MKHLAELWTASGAALGGSYVVWHNRLYAERRIHDHGRDYKIAQADPAIWLVGGRHVARPLNRPPRRRRRHSPPPRRRHRPAAPPHALAEKSN